MTKTLLRAKQSRPSRSRRNSNTPDVRIGNVTFGFSARTYIMGVLNVTPDSFSDGGLFLDTGAAIQRGIEMAREGADCIDVGGESTRPGAAEVSESEEIDRVVPVIEGLAKSVKIPLSVDTRKSRVAEAAVRAGARIINDVSGLHNDEAIAKVAAKYGTMLILMHARGTPKTMQNRPHYKDVMREVIKSLQASMQHARSLGVSQDKIVVDPGIGFGKTVEHNLEILHRLNELTVLNSPICIGTSRKSFIGKILGIPVPSERLAGTLAACTVAIDKGARLLRVHDVKAAHEVARMVDSIREIKIT